MTQYTPPVDDILFLLYAGLSAPQDQIDRATATAILEEAAKLAADVLAPLNSIGNRYGAVLKDGVVTTTAGFKDAYAAYRDGGWNSVPFPPEYGGQGLPWAIAFAVQEMWQAANMSFGLCPLLNQGAVEAIFHHGSPEQKEAYLPRLISGHWTGTMNLTESQAGSDLGLIRTSAVPHSDGTYRISGQKIYITYGEHDLSENIIHLVLARLPDAPEDVKGISLFIVPKFLGDGTRNDLVCTGLEHKLGIHASPTCTMQFGDSGGAVGYLVGKPNEGLKAMFTMMNNARLCVGLQGVAVADRAYQQAYAFAQERIQGKNPITGQRIPIAQHPDVRRMLLTMRSQILAARAMTYQAALDLDRAASGDTQARARVDFMTPIVKSYATDMAVEVASLGIQVYGGMGFIAETGAAQYLCDARILPIYEGTNGIQAADFLLRKVLRDEGAVLNSYLDDLCDDPSLADDRKQIRATLSILIQQSKASAHDFLGFAAVPFLKGCALVFAASHLIRLSCHADASQEIKECAKFFVGTLLPHARAYFQAVGSV